MSKANAIVFPIVLMSMGLMGMLWLINAPRMFMLVPAGVVVYPLVRKPTSGFFWLAFLAPFSAVFEKVSFGLLSPFLLLGLLSLIAASLTPSKAKVPRWYMTLFWLFMATTAMAFLATSQAEQGSMAIGITTVAHLLLSMTVVWVLRVQKDIESLLWAFILGGALASVASVLLYYFPQLGAPLDIEPFDLRKRRFNGLGKNPNAMTSFYVLSVPLSFWGALTWRGIRRWVAITGLSVGILVILFSQSRSAIMGVVISMAVVPWLIPSGLLSRKIRRNIRLSIVLVPVALALFLMRTGQTDAIQDRVQEVGISEGAEGRKDAISATLNIIFNNPFGIGYSQVKELIDEYGQTDVKTPHNSMVTIGAESGWLGVFGALFLVFAPLYYGARSTLRSTTGSQALLASACVAAMLGFWIHSSFHVVHHLAAFWIAMGLSVAIWKNGVVRS